MAIRTAPPLPLSKCHSTRADAPFIAQLIAKRADMPVSRVKRRLDAAEGALVYRTVADLCRASGARDLQKI